ncbi:hypothetical protein [Corynebacterium kalidii]
MSRDQLIAAASTYAADNNVHLSYSQVRRLVNNTLKRIDKDAERTENIRLVTGDEYSTLQHSDPTADAAIRNIMRQIDRMAPAGV